MRRLRSTLALALLALAWGTPARAIIKVDLPVAKMCQSSRAVAVGSVTRVDAGRSLAEVGAMQAIKGAGLAERIRLQFASPQEFARQVAEGQEVVLFLDATRRGDLLVHIADTWLLAQRVEGGDMPLWRTVQAFDGARSFPGRTKALVAVVKELAAGRPGIQDWISHEAFLGSVSRVGDLGGRALFAQAIDLNGDGRLDLVAGREDGARVLMSGADGFRESTSAWGIEQVIASHAAVGDVNGDGKADLLLGRRLWLREGDCFVAANADLPLPPEAEWLAVALGDATADGRVDAVVLSRTGELTIASNSETPDKAWARSGRALWKGGEPALAAVFSEEWGDDGRLHVMVVHPDGIVRYPAGMEAGSPADFQRLTGMPLSSYTRLGSRPLRVLLATAIDYDGNGRTDFMLVTEGGGVTLANRGFGGFLVNQFVQQQFDWRSPVKLPKLPYELTAQTAAAPGRRIAMPNKRMRQNLLVVKPEGTIYEMDNTR